MNHTTRTEAYRQVMASIRSWIRLWAGVVCAGLLGTVAHAADIGGYMEDQAKRQAEAEIKAGFEDVASRAKQRDPEAQYHLGLAYRNGWGVRADPLSAAAWLREAADQGHAKAQYALAAMYEAGEGVPLDLDKARKWYGEAAERGLPEAHRRLSALVSRDAGAPQAGD